jgi:hypothetical protein
LGWVQYQHENMADNRLLAEVGFSLFGVLHTGYGRYIPLQGTYNNFVPQGRWFIP